MRFDRVATLITSDIEEVFANEEVKPEVGTEIAPATYIQTDVVSEAHVLPVADTILSVFSAGQAPVFAVPRVFNTRIFISNDFVEATHLPDAIRQLRAEVMAENSKRNIRRFIFELIVISAILVYAYQCQILWRLFAIIGFVLFVICAVFIFVLTRLDI